VIDNDNHKGLLTTTRVVSAAVAALVAASNAAPCGCQHRPPIMAAKKK